MVGELIDFLAVWSGRDDGLRIWHIIVLKLLLGFSKVAFSFVTHVAENVLSLATILVFNVTFIWCSACCYKFQAKSQAKSQDKQLCINILFDIDRSNFFEPYLPRISRSSDKKPAKIPPQILLKFHQIRTKTPQALRAFRPTQNMHALLFLRERL
jgi:hypothetical protein